jgi:hypothetical protein
MVPFFMMTTPRSLLQSRRPIASTTSWWALCIAATVALTAPAWAQSSLALAVGAGVSPADGRVVSSYFDADVEKLGFSPSGKKADGADAAAAATAAARASKRDTLAGRLSKGPRGLVFDVAIVGPDGAVYASTSIDLVDAEDRKGLRKALARVVQAYRKRAPGTSTAAPDAKAPEAASSPTSSSTAPSSTPPPPSSPAENTQPSSPPTTVETTAPTATTEAAPAPAPAGDNPWITPIVLVGSSVGFAAAAVGLGVLAQGNIDAIEKGRADDVGGARLGAILAATGSDLMTVTAIAVGVVGVVAAVLVATSEVQEGTQAEVIGG